MKRSVFCYRNNSLCAEAIPLPEIIEQVDTPFSCTSAKQIVRNYQVFSGAFADFSPLIHYAVRANPSLAVLHLLASCGAGAEVVSAGELERALEAGIEPAKIIMAGSGKSQDDIIAALLARVRQITVGSLSELALVCAVAQNLGLRASISLLVNVTDVQRDHVGMGLDLDDLPQALWAVMDNKKLFFDGLTVAVPDMDSYDQMGRNLQSLTAMLRNQGFVLDRLSIMSSNPFVSCLQEKTRFDAYTNFVRQSANSFRTQLSLGAGAFLVGDAAVLVARVLHSEKKDGRQKILLDISATDMMDFGHRRYEILPLRQPLSGDDHRPTMVVGPVYDANDLWGRDYDLPTLQEGDWVAVMQTGAFGSSLSAMRHGRPSVPEVMISGAQYDIVRRRLAVAEQTAWEQVPDWMGKERVAS